MSGVLRDFHLLTAKPVMYVANVSTRTASPTTPAVGRVEKRAAGEGAVVVAGMRGHRGGDGAARRGRSRGFLAELGLNEPGLNRVIRGAYKLLGLQTYFTAGPKEVRAWTVRMRVDGAAGGGGHSHRFRAWLHSRGSHRYDDYIANKGEAGAKEVGKLRLEGKEYICPAGKM
jgi:ribosome-binding ATPase YchF (GTP1/OBG family)